jgi:nanoRNase/pAp phosphatase (c-di-AMP/oligoRNAs hydrolase)
MAILFTEGVRGTVRMNFRGKGGISVLALAGAVGGGGHEQAAGAVLECTISQALDRVLPLAQKYLDLQQPDRPAVGSTATAGEPIDLDG